MRNACFLRPQVMEWAVASFVFISVLWRGGKGLEMTWLLGGAAVIAILFSCWREYKSEQRKEVPMVVWGVAALFLLWTVSSFIVSSARNYGLDEVLRDAALVLLFFWIIRHPRPAAGDSDRSLFGRLIAAMAVATLAACVVGVVVYLSQPVNRMVGTFFDYRFSTDYWPNAWAQYLLLAWPAVWLWSRRMRRLVRLPLMAFVLGCLLLSYSRGALLAFALQLIFWLAIVCARHVRDRRRLPTDMLRRVVFDVLTVAAIAIVLFFAVNRLRAIHYPVQSVSAKATFTAEEGESSITERRAFWNAAWELSKARPLFGWGPYSFRFVQPSLQTSVFETSDHPHDVFLKLVMERGWPAAILFLLILGLVLIPAFWRSALSPQSFDAAQDRPSAISDQPKTSNQKPVTLSGDSHYLLIVAIVGVIAHNLIDYNLQFVGIALPFWLFLGFLAHPVQRRSAIHARIMRIVEVLLAVALGCVLVFEGRELLLSSMGRRAEARGDGQAALAWYRRAHGELFPRDMYLSETRLLTEQGDVDGASAALKLYMQSNSEDARAWELAGDLEQLRGNPPGALSDYGNAWQLGKYNYLGILTGSLQALADMHDQELITRMKPDFETVYHAYGDAILHNTHFIALSQNVEQFVTATILMEKLYPSSALAYKTFAKQVTDHARDVRSKLAEAHPGFLW